ncbi:FAD-dependent monooxygenase [Streptomyces massasporeus]
MVDTDVLIVGAGPVGLTAAAELRRQGVTCRIIDRLPARLPYAEAVGVQPPTLELWDRMVMVRAATAPDGREAVMRLRTQRGEWRPPLAPLRRRARRTSQDCGRLPWFAPFLRRAFFLRRRFEDIGPPLSGFRSPSTGSRAR